MLKPLLTTPTHTKAAPACKKHPFSWLITAAHTCFRQRLVRVMPLFSPLERLLIVIRNKTKPPPQPQQRIFLVEDVRTALANASQRLDLPRWGHHAFRHFFCSNAIESGCDFKVIAGWLGHRDGGVLVATTYGHLRQEHSTEMARRITFDAGVGGAIPCQLDLT